MRHTLNSKDVDGTYRHLIAASSGSGGTKRLFIVTVVLEGEPGTHFAVDLKDETLFRVGNLSDAIDFYNDL